MRLPLERVAAFTRATGEFEQRVLAEGYSIDSRTLRPGELFFAVKGERLDGHGFVEAALAAGAVGAVVRRDRLPHFSSPARLLAVEEPLAALQDLAAAVRRLWGRTLIAVTGSMGKTTTKDAIAHVLGTRWRVMKSEGNLNNQFGLPLQLLRLEPEHEMAVVELGMSHAGEITALARMAQPEMGVVTNVAPVHLEFFDSIAGIARAKYELIAALPAGGTAVLNGDDEYVSQFGRDFHGRVVTFGLGAACEVRAEQVEARGAAGMSFELVAGGCREPVALRLLGEHNVYNALAAATVALIQGMTPSEAVRALGTLAPAEKRGQVLESASVTVINDCYNSNPKALCAMVDALARMPGKRRIVVAGEMLELGPAAAELHRECGRHIAARKLDALLGVRGEAEHLVEAARAAGMKAEFAASAEDAGRWMAENLRAGDVVLLKASRGVRLEQALEGWQGALRAALQK
jgi:UDP-N-acetylmuramoyl-tripeptide--D-alanyl-D-alanine ligase